MSPFLLFYVSHHIERQGKQYVCTVCQQTWRLQSMIHNTCPRQSDMPVYIGWKNTPAHLQTESRLHRNGLKPGGPHRAAFRYNHHGYIYWLYDIHEAVPRPKPTLKQLINLGHPSVTGMWICDGCRQVFQAIDTRFPGLLCKDCARKWPHSSEHSSESF